MSSFGEGIQMTPFAASFAGGRVCQWRTLYYLQYPRSVDEQQAFAPRIKRELHIEQDLPELREGMLAAVLYGTGKSSFDRGGDENTAGQDGHGCDDHITPSRIGWFGNVRR